MAKLKVEPREVIGKKVKNLRAEGKIPASLFGPKFESTNVMVDEKSFQEVFKKAGHSALVDVETPAGKKEKVLFREVQIHPVTDEVLHIAMYVIDPTKELSTEIPIEYYGVSPAEENGEGFVAYSMDTLAIRCLPKDLPTSIQVDIAALDEPGTSILVSSIVLPDGVELDYHVELNSALAYLATAQKIEDVLEEIAEGEDAETEIEGDEDTEGEDGEGAAEGDEDADGEDADAKEEKE